MLNRIKIPLSIILLTVLALAGGLAWSSQPANAAGPERTKLPPIELPAKGNPRLDSKLNKLASANVTQKARLAQQNNVGPESDTVRVVVESSPGQAKAVAKAIGASGVVEASYGDLLQVKVPVSQLTALANTAGVKFARLPYEPLPAVISEGVALIGADQWQSSNVTGAGVKVGILDLGFSGYTARQSAGELPASITTWWAPSIGGPGTSIHGTACAEIVYDMAPGAQFYLANFNTEVEMGNAVDWFISQGVNVISCSVGWPIGGPGNGTGDIDEIVDSAHAAGIFWSQSVGNSARRHWQGNFTDTNADHYNEFNQSPLDEANAIYAGVGATITAVLKWDDTWGASANDYDLLLFNNTSTLVAASMDVQDGTGDPVEGLSYIVPSAGYYYTAIYTFGSPQVKNFHLYSYNQDLNYQTAAGSLIVPADSANATALGAVFWNSPGTLESFSSQGPTQDNRKKPDLVAPDGVSGATYGASNGVAFLSGGTGFFGTSASAPHAAGAAVLVKQRYPAYTPAQIQSFLESIAVDLGSAGKDNLYGSGRLWLGTHTLTMAASSNGTTTPSAGAHAYLVGSTVNITATPDSGWRFVNWTGGTGTVANVNSANTTVTMNADYSITANFSQVTLTMAKSGNGTVTPSEGAHTYAVGATVNITATPAAGWEFTIWSGTVTDNTSANTTVVMNADKTVTANFTQIMRTLTMAASGNGTVTPAVGSHTYPMGSTVNITATAAVNWAFLTWTGNVSDNTSANTTVVMNTNKTATAYFTRVASTLTMSVSGNGNITPTAGAHTYAVGASVNITATPDSGWRFVNWSGDVGTVANVNSANSTVTMNGDYLVTANFSQAVLTMVKSGNGTVTPSEGAHTYAVGATANITATPAAGWRFVNWSGDTATVVNVNSTNTTVIMNSDYSITANFSQSTLTMAVSGSGSTTPSGAHTYAVGSTVNITATAAANWAFVNWSGAVTDNTSANTTVVMNTDKTITAYFTRVAFTLTMSVSGNGTVTPSAGQHTYPLGATVNIGATATKPWSVFSSWSGNVLDAYSTNTTVTMNSDQSVTANFMPFQGKVVYTAYKRDPGNLSNPYYDLYSMNADGSGMTRLTYTTEDWESMPALSPDGTLIAFPSFYYHDGQTLQIYLMNADGSGKRQLTFGPGISHSPAWSPDGRKIVFVSERDGNPEIYIMNADGSGQTMLTNNSGNVLTPSFKPDGSKIIYASEASGYSQIWLMNLDGTGKTQLTTTPRSKLYPVYAPNESLIAFSAAVDTLYYLYTVKPDGTNESQVIGPTTAFTNGRPAWCPNGNIIIYNYTLNGFRDIRWVSADGSNQDRYIHFDEVDKDATIGPATRALTLAVNGSGTTTPAVGTHTYPIGTTVTITATPASGWQFSSWTGAIVNPNSASTAVIMNTDKTVTANFSQPAQPPAEGGGGGGGGGGGDSVGLMGLIGESGRFNTDLHPETLDHGIRMDIAEGTIGKNPFGVALHVLFLKTLESPPGPARDATFVSQAYNLGPDAATFNPPITITMRYDHSRIPTGGSEDSLYIATWDAAAREWLPVPGTTDKGNDTISARASHFSVYAVLAGISPAKITTQGLNISPPAVKAGGRVDISVLVTNTGGLKGSRSITLQIDNADVQTKEVALNGSEKATVDFTFTAEKIGVHNVKVDGLEGKFEVLPAAATFEIKLLTVPPVEITAGDEARLRVLVTNTSAVAGTCNVTLKMDGVISEVRQVAVSAKASQELTFTASPNAAGDYHIDINGAQALLTVRDKTPEIAPTPEPASKSPAPEPAPFNKWLLAGIITASVLAILAAVYLLRLRKRKSKAS